MNTITKDLEPQAVLGYFEEICKIPHGSYHTEAISDYLAAFAETHGLDYKQDRLGNVVIFRPATSGHEGTAPIILQGHMDMVLEKNDDVEIDLVKEPIELRVDGDYLTANGTTLGGDDGIAVAMMLALLDSDTIVHPPLECIFTVDEETGMEGALGLDTSILSGRRMINLDSEEEGIITVGCAGGAEEHITIPVTRNAKKGLSLHLAISGLVGGHSGMAIHLGRANADLLMGRLLDRIGRKAEFRIVTINGGSKDNAIPRTCEAEILFSKDTDTAVVTKAIEKFRKQIANEYRYTDPDIETNYEWNEEMGLAVDAMTRRDSKRIVQILMTTPNGLIAMDPNYKDLPQTSLNLGIVQTDTDSVTLVYLVRSSINSAKKYLMRRLSNLADLFDARTSTVSEYPAWEYAPESRFRDELVRIYKEQTGKEPVVAITHGGLECGLLADKIKGLDCVSIGPDMEGIHAPGERLSIPSVQRTWNYLLAILRELA